ncbi:MAG TPA: GTPase, partial [Acidimicrobiia bacterium]|nr:GTPase [Acidimicrobiia bacterium]
MLDHPPSPERLATVAAALDRLPTGVDRAARDEAARLIGYTSAHLGNPGADLVVAVVGVGGSGKSTLVNTMARRRVSAAGTRRPTTTEIVAWGGDRLPAVLDRLRRTVPGKMVAGSVPPLPGLVVVDTPPPEVTDADGRPLCHSVIDVADVCLLVAAANRYADAAGFEMARRAAGRGAAVVVVLNRLPPTPELQRELRSDFARKLAVGGVAPGIGPDDVIAVAEGPISRERHGLASEAVLGVIKELERLGADRDAVRAAAVAGTLHRTAGLLAALRAGLVTAAARRIELSDPV